MTRWIEKALANYIRKSVHDPQVAEALIPDYSFFCKRPSLSNTFYPMFNKEHVRLVTDPISHVTETGIATKDGTIREVDAIICATGLHVYDRSSAPMFTIIGEGGKDLGEWWADTRYRAHYGTTVPDFPNLFLIFGPYAAAGSGYHDIVGSQIAHLSRILRAARKRGSDYVALKPEAFDAEFRSIDRKIPSTVLYAGNCGSSHTYYLDPNGDTGAAPRPGSATAHWLKVRLVPVNEYRYDTRGAGGSGNGHRQGRSPRAGTPPPGLPRASGCTLDGVRRGHHAVRRVASHVAAHSAMECPALRPSVIRGG